MINLALLLLTLARATPPADCSRYLTQLIFPLAGDGRIVFLSDQKFVVDADARDAFAAHLPASNVGMIKKSTHVVTHERDPGYAVARKKRGVSVRAPWGDGVPADLPHLIYGVARRAWLKRGFFPVHAACVGDDERGYVLLVGAAGSGKTSLALDAVTHGLKLFSGDKTLVRVTNAGGLEAIAGTRRLTVRRPDVWRWRGLTQIDANARGERLSFALEPAAYSARPTVPIRAVFTVRVNEGVETLYPLPADAALHTLYPLFVDKQREDVLLGGDRALFDGTLKPRRRKALMRSLARGLARTPSREVTGPLPFVRRAIFDALGIPRERGRKKIVLGICGIGNGHLNRQLPVLEHLLASGDDVLVFAYGESLRRLRETHGARERLTILEVANPYYVGAPDGLDFGATARAEVNGADFLRVNARTLDRATREFGRPDLVISDYEMVSAQFAYAKDVPLITLDQQSKFLAAEDLPKDLAGTSARDEVERLSLFFPRAAERLVASFFRLAPGPSGVRVLPPMIREGIRARRDVPPSARPSVYVYFSAQKLGDASPEDAFLAMVPELPPAFDFHVYWPRRRELPASTLNVFFKHHGASDYDDRLAAAHAVITTAGHTLISEAMFLNKPVLAMPLPLYEQQLNAHVIDSNGFGLNRASLTFADVREFLDRLGEFNTNIRDDRNVLFKESGNAAVIERIEAALSQ